MAYDPNVFDLEAGEEVDFADKQNLARLLHATTKARCRVLVEHWRSGTATLGWPRELLATYGPSAIPTIVAGDLNSTASGRAVTAPMG